MRWACANEGATRNGVFVAAKENFDSTSVTPGPESAGTLLRVQFDVWTMLACYFPQGIAKSRYFDACQDVAEAVTWAVTRPSHFNVDLLVLRPRAQAAQHKLHRAPA